MVGTNAPRIGSVSESWPQDPLHRVQPASVRVLRPPALRTDHLLTTDRPTAPIVSLHV